MVQPARKPKRTSFEEVARVVLVYDALAEEVARRLEQRSSNYILDDEGGVYVGELLEIADRIAARTED